MKNYNSLMIAFFIMLCPILSNAKTLAYTTEWGGSCTLPTCEEGEQLSGDICIQISPLAARSQHTCYIKNEQVKCWGSHTTGALGNGTSSGMTLIPTVIGGILSGEVIKSISKEGYALHSLVINKDGKGFSWGRNGGGMVLGTNFFADTTNNFLPYEMTLGSLSSQKFKYLTGSLANACGQTMDNKTYCWGDNLNGQVGANNPTAQSILIPTLLHSESHLSGLSIKKTSMGGFGGCVIASNDKLYCWGGTTFGAVGNGVLAGPPVFEPTPVIGDIQDKEVKSIAAGARSVCAIDSLGKAYCWGRNNNGQLGIGSSNNSSTSVQVQGVLANKVIKQISVGGNHACALDSDGLAYCWGNNGELQLGLGYSGNQDLPQPVKTSGALAGKTLIHISAGETHTCAESSDHNVYCWGSNSTGELGNGVSGASVNEPVMVQNL